MRYRKCRLALMIAMGLGAGGAFAQSTTGSIAGQVAPGAGDSVHIESDTGFQRDVPVDARGRYAIPQLPLGSYTVTLRKGGNAVQSRGNVSLRVGVATDVSFQAQAAQNLEGVAVSANATPPIDVTSVDSRTVITSQQMARLPLGFSAESVARLAPGVVGNAGGFTSDTGNSLISFGGSAANENAYYINGFNTTDPLQSAGGLTLPYGSIEQEQVYTGGYSAQYGRSDGGVLNMVGKRGSNEWHFGGKLSWDPASLRASYNNTYYQNGLPPVPVAGSLYVPRSRNSTWNTVYDAYVGGPLIKDKLFFFASAEMAKSEGTRLGDVTSTSPYTSYTYKMPKWYGKLDWNIDDNNILELTGAANKRQTSGDIYRYDYNALRRGDLLGQSDETKRGGTLWTAKYTGYLTDSLTLSAQYGKMRTTNFVQPVGYNPGLTYISGTQNQNPLYTGGSPRTMGQTTSSIYDPGQGNRSSNLRVSLAWAIGDHTITAGIDNLDSQAVDQGSRTAGPGYSWSYGYTANPGNGLAPKLGVGAPSAFPNGAGGYYVMKNVSYAVASVRSRQRAQYLEDQWQVNDRLLLSLGLRNDQFTNYNANGQAYIAQTKPQWAPRLGFSWDVNGDASFKVYGNVGRYFLGSPLAPALSAAGAYTSTTQYFTYSGITPDGIPTGLTPMSGPVSANNAFGVLPDPRTVTAKGLKSEYQDEYMLGFSKSVGDQWVYGAKLSRRVLRTAIDDFCDVDRIKDAARAQGVQAASVNSCYLINGGAGNTFVVLDAAGAAHDVKLTRDELGFPKVKRNYYALDTFFEHPFDGKWYGRVDYTFSRSYGNTEGLTQSNVQSDGPSQSEDWDFASLMVYSGGLQGNNHKHQLKLYGYYQFTPEWLVSANLSLISGSPAVCLGLFGPDNTDPSGYNSNYHFCNGRPAPPGSTGNMPWQRQLDLGVKYAPAFADNKLGFHLDIFNVTNNQVALNLNPHYYLDATASPNPLYRTPLVLQDPRYVRFSVTYDY
ncbi:TonB-dependent receptor domain-containing protein [Luteibacter anthropi]|uniref:TonB-dependent receptor domain-containing protein n=1 Tax=Luteibacter anthropi TaxID=564369 RepID=UPI0020322295|nr:TonB-dependent receptor [Luteibacter anthropi]